MTLVPFGQRLCEAVRRAGTPLMVGIDPRQNNLPEEIKSKITNGFSVAAAFEEFSCEVIDLVANRVAVIKPQFAFFEQLGPAGMSVLKNVVRYASEKQLIVIGDAKRGDIGSTATAYANAYLDPGNSASICCDALTVNPYMGFDTIEPFVETAEKYGNGIFVLVKTSNPGSGQFQDAKMESGVDGTATATNSNDCQSLFENVGQRVQELNRSFLDAHPQSQMEFGNVGAVIGATYPGQLKNLRQQMPNTLFLIPGYGAQGGAARDVVAGFNRSTADNSWTGAVVNSSRGIIFAYENPVYREQFGEDWRAAIVQSLSDSIDSIGEACAAN